MGIAERKTREKQALRERILDAARRIVVREGFDGLSMRKIADAIEYSPATLYLHFENRDEIARALCSEGYAALLATLQPVVAIADPGEQLRALAHKYVSFGVAHPETYRLMFMEDPSYTDAAFALQDASDESGDASMQLMIGAFDALKAQQRLPASIDSAVSAEALWATMHGIVALQLTCPVFPHAPLEALIDAALDAWVGRSGAAMDTASAVEAPASAAATNAARSSQHAHGSAHATGDASDVVVSAAASAVKSASQKMTSQAKPRRVKSASNAPSPKTGDENA